jgi:hypothetical protein
MGRLVRPRHSYWYGVVEIKLPKFLISAVDWSRQYDSFTRRPPYHRREGAQCQINRRLDGLQSKPRRNSEYKYLPPAGIKPGRLHHIQSHNLSRLYRKTLLSVSFYITNSVAPGPAGSSPYSQEPATGSYPELNVSTLHSRSQSP